MNEAKLHEMEKARLEQEISKLVTERREKELSSSEHNSTGRNSSNLRAARRAKKEAREAEKKEGKKK